MFECWISAIQMRERRFIVSLQRVWLEKETADTAVRRSDETVEALAQRPCLIHSSSFISLFPPSLPLWVGSQGAELNVMDLSCLLFCACPLFLSIFHGFLSLGWTVSRRNLATQMWSVCWRGGLCSFQTPLRKRIISLYMAIRHVTHYRPSIRHWMCDLLLCALDLLPLCLLPELGLELMINLLTDNPMITQ